jgi:lipoprotein-anchoring transpeptidase ErfK/SrfK
MRAVALAVAAVLAGLAGAVLARGSDHTRPTPAAAARLPPSPAGALHIGAPIPAGSGRHESRWAPVRRTVVARSRPSASARAVARLTTRTPEGTSNIVPALGRGHDARGRLWVRVRLPVLPADTTGWVPRSALGGYGVVTTHLVVDSERLTATLFRDGRRVFRARVGVGTSAAPTPHGHFWVRNRLTRYRSSFYGPVALGTGARSPALTDWPGGGFIGIHGTDRPDLIPGRVSHGCIRMRNRDIVRLARLLPMGTPVTII